MKVINKKVLRLLLILGGVLTVYLSWLSLRQVEIISVHKSDSFSDVLVKSFPLSDKGKIGWWLKNKEMLHEKYNIPISSSSGDFTITFWDFGDGYKYDGKYDRLCFEDITTKENCIEKDVVFSVSNSVNLGITFTVYDGQYQMKKNGDIVKFENHFEVR